jgi:hypothetical protein
VDTLLTSIERWYDQPHGTIYLDGVDIRELNLTWLRTNIRLVQQEPVLFAGTVYENVASGLFGTEHAALPDAEQRVLVAKACEDAYADEFIERLPKVCRMLLLMNPSNKHRATTHSWENVPRISQVDRSNALPSPAASSATPRSYCSMKQQVRWIRRPKGSSNRLLTGCRKIVRRS